MKLTKRIMLTVLALAFALSMVFAVCLLSGKTVEASSTATSSPALKEVTLTKMTAAGSETATDVEYVEFANYKDKSAYFLVDYVGKNVPNFAVRATKAYSTWTGTEDLKTAGIMLQQTTRNASPYAGNRHSQGLAVTNGTTTGEFEFIFGEQGKGPGLDYMVDGTRYVMIVGYKYVNESNYTVSYYLFSVGENDALTLVHSLTKDDTIAAGGSGTVAVIYPNIRWSATTTITFSYAQPAPTLKGLLQGISDKYEYKETLAEQLNLGDVSLIETTLNKINAEQLSAVSNVGYVAFDDYAEKNAFVMFDFVGKNIPNLTVRAQQAMAEWPAAAGSSWAWSDFNRKAGVMLCQTTRQASPYGYGWQHNNLVVCHGTTNIQGANTNTPEFTDKTGVGLANFADNVHYIVIVGYSATDGRDNDVISYYVFTETEGQLALVNELTMTAMEKTDMGSGALGTKIVLYPNINYGSDKITFKYAQPASTLEGLVNGLPSGYTYKSALKEELIGNTATVKGADGETVKTENFKGSYTLPEYSNVGVIGYNVDGKLYAKGDVITATTDITVTEVELNLNMDDGAKARVSDNGTQYGGLRFTVTADAETVDTYGIAVKGQIIPTDLIDGTYDVGETGAKSVDLTTFDTEDGVNTYCITLTNVLYTNYNRAFSALAYATVTYEDGDTATVTTAYDVQKNSRSIYQVAVKASNDTTEDYTTTQRGILNSYISYTVNLVNVEGSVSVATAEDGLNDVSLRKYTAVQDGNTVTITISDLPARLAGITHASLTVYNGTAFARVLVPVTVDGTTATATYTLG